MAEIKTIGFVIPTLESGGAERVVAILADALSLDFKVHIFLSKGAKQHFPIERAELHFVDLTYDTLFWLVQDLSIDLLLDHYHWNEDHVRMMARLADNGPPIILSEHNAWHHPLFQRARRSSANSQNWFTERYGYYAKFAAVTVLNQTAFRYFSMHIDNAVVVPNPLPPARSCKADPWSRRLLTVSHFGKQAKRIDLLYRAYSGLLARVPDAKLTVLGDYDLVQDRYYRMASGLGDAAVETPGRTSRVDSYLDRSAVFALTSEIEGQPMVLLEAAQHGMPQIAFDLPGLEDQLIHGETGLLVPFGDWDAFADAAAGLITDPARIQRMGRAARAFVRHEFSLLRILDRWRALIDEVATRGRVQNPSGRLPEALIAADQHWQAYWQNAAQNAPQDQVPKVSFLVPVHGTEELLPRCLHSIQAQSLAEFECIVVDDGSPGDVEAVVRANVGDDPRFRVIRHGANRGLYQARSTAAAAAGGLYFAHVDSDDYIHPQFAEIMFAEAVATGAEIVECQAIELREDGRPVRFNVIMPQGPVDGDQAARAFFANQIRNVVWNKLYARDLWRRVPGHMQIDCGLSICEDLLRNSLLFPESRRYVAVQDCLYFYCRRPSSVVKGGDLQRLLTKLSDVETAYQLSLAGRRAAGDAEAIPALEARRAEDLAWYVEEYQARHAPEALAEDLQSLEKAPAKAISDLVAQFLEPLRAKAALALPAGKWQQGGKTSRHGAGTRGKRGARNA